MELGLLILPYGEKGVRVEQIVERVFIFHLHHFCLTKGVSVMLLLSSIFFFKIHSITKIV